MPSRSANPVRLVIALSVAGVLAVFLLYTSIAGGTTTSLSPSQLAGHPGRVGLAGLVVGSVHGDAHGSGLVFRLRDVNGRASVPVLYRGSVPDLFQVGRRVWMSGQLRRGVFIASRDSLVTKCPSKYAAKKQ